MDLGVAVCATPVEIPNRIKQRGSCGMTARDVARIAHARHPPLEQLRIVCSVRFVAIRTIFHPRRVFPQERPAPLLVAAQAVLRCAMGWLIALGLLAALAAIFPWELGEKAGPFASGPS